MTTWAIRSESDRASAIKAIEGRALPCTVQINKGAPRSIDQNRLNRLWMNELQSQGDQTAEEYRAYCKLHIGVPLLRSENDQFREAYDRVVKPLDYELKLEAMAIPLDFPVTRLMTTRQEKYYLDQVYTHFTGKGFQLTDPDTFGVDLK